MICLPAQYRLTRANVTHMLIFEGVLEGLLLVLFSDPKKITYSVAFLRR